MICHHQRYILLGRKWAKSQLWIWIHTEDLKDFKYRVVKPVDNEVHKTNCGREELIESADSGVNTTIFEIWYSNSLVKSVLIWGFKKFTAFYVVAVAVEKDL